MFRHTLPAFRFFPQDIETLSQVLLFNHLSNFKDESIITFWLSSFCGSLFLQYKPHIGKKKSQKNLVFLMSKMLPYIFPNLGKLSSVFIYAFTLFFFFALAVIWLAVFARPTGLWRRAPRPLAVACCQCRTWVTAWSVWTRRRSCRCSRCRTSAPSCLEVRRLIKRSTVRVHVLFTHRIEFDPKEICFYLSTEDMFMSISRINVCGLVSAGLMCSVKPDGVPQLCKADEIGELCVCTVATGSSYYGLTGMTKNTFEVRTLISFLGALIFFNIYIFIVGNVTS